MHSESHHFENLLEPQELLMFGRAKWVCFEERHDLVFQITEFVHRVVEEIFSVIVLPSVAIDPGASERSLGSSPGLGRYVHLAQPKTEVVAANLTSALGFDEADS